MADYSKKHKLGVFLCWVLIIVIFLCTMIAIFYNGFLNKYRLEKLEEYLYSVECSNYNYDVIDKILEMNLVSPGCSTVRKGNVVGRNLDWTYDDSCEFVVTTLAENGRHRTIGLTSLTGITRKSAINFRFNINYAFLPFYTVDGINDQGLFVCINEVPSGDAGITTGTNPGGDRLSTVLAVRYLLDYADSVDDAIRILKEKDLYSYNIDGEPYEIHFMLSDVRKNVVVEIVNNKLNIVEDCNIMTNFYISLDEYTDHAEGIERYQILLDGYDSVNDEESMRSLLKEVYYSKLYNPRTEPAWYSEIYGDYVNASGEEFTVHSDPADFPGILEQEREGYEDRQRDGQFWETCHTSVYNLDELTLSVSAQEHEIVYDFPLEPISELAQQRISNDESRKIMIPLDVMCLMIMLFILYAMFFENPVSDKKSRAFTVMVLSTIVALLSDIGAWIFDGMVTHSKILAFSNYFAIVVAEVMVVAFIWYEYYYIIERKAVSKRLGLILSIFNVAVIIVLTVLALAGKLFYFIDGVYFSTDLVLLGTGASVINITVLLITVICSWKILGTHDTVAFACYGIIPLMVTIYELFYPAIEIAFVAVSLAVLLIFIMLQSGKANTLKLRKELLEEMCYVDQLTNLNNRRAYDEILEKGSNAQNCGVIFCDVNGLKYVNDYLGHKAGDALLIRFANMLMDYFDHDTIFRISGDEFVVIIRDIQATQFDESLERFRKAAISRDDIASVGGAYSARLPASQLISEAENQMYMFKAEYYQRHPENDRRKKSDA